MIARRRKDHALAACVVLASLTIVSDEPAKPIAIRPLMLDTWQLNALAVEPLKAVVQHRPIDLVQDVFANLDAIVGSDSNQLGVKGGMVE